MKNLKLAGLKLSKEESRDIIELIDIIKLI